MEVEALPSLFQRRTQALVGLFEVHLLPQPAWLRWRKNWAGFVGGVEGVALNRVEVGELLLAEEVALT